jgi:hypothetical protein
MVPQVLLMLLAVEDLVDLLEHLLVEHMVVEVLVDLEQVRTLPVLLVL